MRFHAMANLELHRDPNVLPGRKCHPVSDAPLGREVLQEPDIFIVSQPTWGVDAGAAAAIHQSIIDLAATGTAVLVISQELDELFTICDRIAVIAEGRLSDARKTADVTVEEIGLLMGGTHDLPNTEGKANVA